MRMRLLLAVVAWVGFAWVGNASGVCSPEQIDELLYNIKVSKKDMQRLCGRPAVIVPSPQPVPPSPQSVPPSIPRSQHITWLVSILGIVVSLVAGGFAGSLLSSRRQKIVTTFSRVEDYVNNYNNNGEYNKIKTLLQGDPRIWSTDERNSIMRLGDWFELTCTYCNTKHIKNNLLKKIELPEMILEFYNAAKAPNASSRLGGNIDTQWSQMSHYVHKASRKSWRRFWR